MAALRAATEGVLADGLTNKLPLTYVANSLGFTTSALNFGALTEGQQLTKVFMFPPH